jgi:predicted enzyme related to lactoylglutathione lyase
MAVIGLVAPSTGGAQSPSTMSHWRKLGGLAPAGDVVEVGNLIYMVSNIERTVAFYNLLLGVEANGRYNEEPNNYPYRQDFKAFAVAAPMYNAGGTKFKNTSYTVPNSNLGLEFFQWEGNHPPVQKRVFDPGAVMVVLQVRRLQACIDAVKQHGGSFVTPNGEPVPSGNGKVLLIRDPDGLFIELINPDPVPETPDVVGNVVGATFRYTAMDPNRTARFFKDAFGFTVNEARDFADDPVLAKAMGLGTLMQRWAGTTVPGSNLAVQFAQYDSTLGGQKIDQGLPRPRHAVFRSRSGRSLSAHAARQP